MGSHINFRNFDGNDGKPMGNPPLARQPSIYTLTLDEFQNSMGGLGKDFGSMNMDEFLKNIWTAEETQAMASAICANNEGALVGGNLQRQGSLTLPRTLSQKTVDEVWRDLFKENSGKDGGSNAGLNLPHRQQTLGEMTLEEFLVRAGVVREDAQPTGRSNNNGFYGELPHSNNNPALALGYPPQPRTNGVVGNRMNENISNQIPNQSHNLTMNLNGVRSSQQQQQLFPKQAPMGGYASSMQVGNGTESGKSGMRGGVVSMADQTMNNSFMQGGAGMGMVGLGSAGVTVGTGSPTNQLSSDGLGKSNGDNSSLSPVPFVFSGGLRGRKCSGSVEKVVERRQRRMIKNRESAARSRARKQAYTMELEAEVAKLKEENKDLQKKQEEIMEMQKNQKRAKRQKVPILKKNGMLIKTKLTTKVLEILSQQNGSKKRCLRRTQTGPW